MNKILESIRLKEGNDMTDRAVANVMGLSPTTVGRYWRIYMTRGWKLADLAQMTYEEVDELFNLARRRLIKKRLPDFAYIHRMMRRKHQSLERLWEEYRLANPDDAYAYSQFTHLYRQFAMRLDLVMRQTHRAGECAYVDFAGTTVPWIDFETGVQRRAQVFVAVMGCSNYTFMLALPDQKLGSWTTAHDELYAFLGGVPAVVVPDNLKSAVTRPGRELVLNRTYFEQARHYGNVIMPTRPGRPQDKAPVEAGVRFVSRWILAALAGRTYASIDEINADFRQMLPRLNERPFKKLPGSRRSWFEEMDKPALKPLPQGRFEYAEWVAPQKVPADYHVPICRHYYSVPCALVQSYVEARVTARNVEFYQGGKRVATHAISRVLGGHTTLPEHQPPAHRAYAEQTPAKFQEWANGIGPAALAVVRHQFVGKPHTLVGLRASSTLRNLARNYGPERFEAACQRAQVIGSLTVKSVRSILQRGLDSRKPDDSRMEVNLPVHQNIRGRDYFITR
jgi:transposase